MLIDMHVHEELYSFCSRMSLEEAVNAARRRGLDGICITDHGSMEIRETAADYLHSLDFPVFIGVEMTTRQGDIVAFGLESLPQAYLPPAQDFIDHVNREGGFCFSAHPFRTGGGGLRHHLSHVTGLHGVEVWNGGNFDEEDNLKALRECRRLGLTPVAGSDAHRVHDVGSYATWFPHPLRTEAELVAALKAGLGRPVVRTRDNSYAFLLDD